MGCKWSSNELDWPDTIEPISQRSPPPTSATSSPPKASPVTSPPRANATPGVTTAQAARTPPARSAATTTTTITTTPPRPAVTTTPASRAAAAAKAGPLVQCSICFDERPAARFRPLHAGASHANTVCAKCARAHVHSQLTGDHKADNCEVTCCVGTCRAALDDADLARLSVPKADRERLQLNLTRRFLRNQPNARWCAHPGCGNCVLHFGDGNVLLCDSCGNRTCTECLVVFHDGKTCKEYAAAVRQRDGELAGATLLMIQRTCKQCPQCKYYIDKFIGCDHIRCRCGYEFCWRCLADYNAIRREGNSAHNRTCHHYRA